MRSYRQFKRQLMESFETKPTFHFDGKEHPYPDHLKDSVDIANHIEHTSPYDVDHEHVVEHFHGAQAHLKLTQVSSLKVDRDSNSHIREPAKQKAYNKMPGHSAPPIVVENGKIVDGHHRFRAAKHRGDSHIWAYHVTDK